MGLAASSDSVGYSEGIPATHTILGKPWGSSTEILRQEMQSSREWLCHPHCAGRESSGSTPGWWLAGNSLLPPDPQEFQPQALPAHRLWLKWVASVASQLCRGSREAAEALALWSRAGVGPISSPRPLEICPAPLEVAGNAPWNNSSGVPCSVSCFAPPQLPPPAPHPWGTSPARSRGVPRAETAAHTGGDPQIPQKGFPVGILPDEGAEGG